MLSHQILILDLKLNEYVIQENVKLFVQSLITELLNELNMKELGEFEFYPATDVEYPGWSFIQPITTSHISGHYFEYEDKKASLHVDIYSCKKFDFENVIRLLAKYFHIAEWSGNFITRNVDPLKREIHSIAGVGNAINA